jgi:hypothetical protein
LARAYLRASIYTEEAQLACLKLAAFLPVLLSSRPEYWSDSFGVIASASQAGTCLPSLAAGGLAGGLAGDEMASIGGHIVRHASLQGTEVLTDFEVSCCTDWLLGAGHWLVFILEMSVQHVAEMLRLSCTVFWEHVTVC